MLRVFFQFLSGHSFEQIIKAYLLGSVNPLANGVDLAVSLNRRDNGAGGHFHFAGPLNDLFQCGPDVPLTVPKQPEGVRMTVDAGAI